MLTKEIKVGKKEKIQNYWSKLQSMHAQVINYEITKCSMCVSDKIKDMYVECSGFLSLTLAA